MARDSEDDWRNWKDGKYDNRYHRTNRHKKYRNPYKKKQAKKIGIGITLVSLIGIVGFLFTTGMFTIDEKKINESIQDISQNLPSLPNDLPTIPTEVTEPIKNVVDTSVKEINKIQTKIQESTSPQQSTEEDAIKSIQYINQLRKQNGKEPISHDSRVYSLAMARVKDMYDYKYFDHTNPQTGTCPYNMKSNFGLKSNENVAENAHMTGSASMPTLYNPSLTGVVDGWMQSTGHRMNLLSYEHVSGSVACYGGYCVFLGLNQGHYGEGCYTASEGQAYASRFDACTSEQMGQYDSLNQRYESLSKEYDRFPQTSRSQLEYQQAMNMYNQLQTMYNQIINFEC
jgi:uncharacterized protein YkwD